MKVCHAEVMKLIKELEKQKADVLLTERDGCLISYKEGEEPLAGEYNYEEVRREVRRLDTRIRELREICGCSEEQMAKETDLSIDVYRTYEAGTVDLPFSFIHK